MKSLFSERLRQAMNQKNCKQVHLINLAEERNVKLSKSQMSQYLSGRAVPRKGIGMFLAEVLGVTPEWLYGTAEAGEPGGDMYSAVQEKKSAVDSQPGVMNADFEKDTISDQKDIEKNRNREAASDNSKALEKQQGSGNREGNTNMRKFSKSSKLDNVLYDVRGPVVEEANRMEAAGMNVLKLNIGNPAPFGFRTPDEVVFDMAAQLTECEGYSASKGLFSARKAIMQYAQLKGIRNVTVEDIYTGNGVSELINLSMSALLNDEDEVLVPSPDYPLWTACVTLAGGTAVHYICDEQSEWYPDLADMESKITDKTKAIVIINPNNPTGALYPKEILVKIAELARRHQLMVFSDEIYDRLVMDGEEHISFAAIAPDLFCVTFSGLSKSHMIAGYRIGWMIISGNKRIGADYIEGINMLSNMRLCSNVPAQSIVQTALGGHQSVKDYIVPGGRVYEQREFIYKALNDIPGITAVKPKAAFYIFPKIDVDKFGILNDEQFALDLLREKKLLIIHGGGFNWKEPDHFRVVYLPRIEVLKDATEKLADFLEFYHQ